MNSMLHITLYHVLKKLYFIEKYHQNVYSIYIIKLRISENIYPIQTVQANIVTKISFMTYEYESIS